MEVAEECGTTETNNSAAKAKCSLSERKRIRYRIHHAFKHCFLRTLEKTFHSLGFIIASYPYIFILSALLFSSISFGVVNLRFAQRLQDGYTSTNSRSRYEEEVSLQFLGTNYTYTQRFVALLRAVDGGSMLRPSYIKKTLEVHKFLSKSFQVEYNGLNFTHSDICGRYCMINEALHLVNETVALIENAKISKSLPLEDSIIDHPKSTFNEYTYNVAQHLFGIKKVNYDCINSSHHLSSPTEDSIGKSLCSETSFNNRLDHVTLIMLLFYAAAPNEELVNMVIEWENNVFEWIKEGPSRFPELIIDVLGDKVLGAEMVRGGLSMISYLLVGLGLSVLFVMLCVMFSSIESQRFDLGKVLIVLGIIMSPLLAVMTTFGIMGFAGIEVYPIQMVVPFLIIAIGVDDAFLMLHAWNRRLHYYAQLSKQEKTKVVPVMLGEVLEEVGPSITITSLTNVIAFGVGTTVSTPAIQYFCMAACLAMIMDFVFELIFFGSFLALGARFEKVCQISVHGLQNGEPNKFTYTNCKRSERYLRYYCKVLTMTSVRIFLFVFAVVFFVTSLIGTLRIKTYINAQKIIPSDSLLLRADALFEKYHWKEFEPLQIFVNNPPNISDHKERDELFAMVKDFESLPKAIGSPGTILWLNDYQKVVEGLNLFTSAVFNTETELSYDTVPDFTEDMPFWNQTLKWHIDSNGKVQMDAFYFVTGYCNSTSWLDRANLMLQWREVADRWRKFNVTVYSENSPVYEGIFGLKGTTIQTATITLICMLAVCIFFIPSAAGILTAGWAICSISLGVFGYLCWWGLDLDPVTMSAIVMSIGFSVDYTAHITFHYQRARQFLPRSATKCDRLVYTLDSVGWPMIQAAISTIVCFIPVAFHNDYTPSVFMRAITLVVGWGLLHGLILLPTILATLPDCLFVDVDEWSIVKSPTNSLHPYSLSDEKRFIQSDFSKTNASGLEIEIRVHHADKIPVNEFDESSTSTSTSTTATTTLLTSKESTESLE